MSEHDHTDLIKLLKYQVPKDTPKELALLVMGSPSDWVHAQIITDELWDQFKISSLTGIYSAHKNTAELLKLVATANPIRRLVYIAIAGMSNALGAVIYTHTTHPVINCPPYSDPLSSADLADVASSYRMPSGIGTMLVIGARNAAWATASIFSNNNPQIAHRLDFVQETTYGKNLTECSKSVQKQRELERVKAFLET